jgi:hypothetical protein
MQQMPWTRQPQQTALLQEHHLTVNKSLCYEVERWLYAKLNEVVFCDNMCLAGYIRYTKMWGPLR